MTTETDLPCFQKKKCKRCGVEKNIMLEFDKQQHQCKDCKREISRESRKKNYLSDYPLDTKFNSYPGPKYG
jgi:hypothetical protein